MSCDALGPPKDLTDEQFLDLLFGEHRVPSREEVARDPFAPRRWVERQREIQDEIIRRFRSPARDGD